MLKTNVLTLFSKKCYCLSACFISNVTISVSRFWDESRSEPVNPSTCLTSSRLPGGTRTVIPCAKELTGRYVDIRKLTYEPMSLCMCEVEVYGSTKCMYFVCIFLYLRFNSTWYFNARKEIWILPV